jgi:hypothetical protein
MPVICMAAGLELDQLKFASGLGELSVLQGCRDLLAPL